jgi:hypothetical protein
VNAAAETRELILASSERFWRASDLGAASHRRKLGRELARLAKEGELIRVRPGLYWRGRQTKFGISLPSLQAVLTELLPADACPGYSGHHAANQLGLSTQVPALEQIAVCCRPPTGIERVRFYDRRARTGRQRQKLSGLEVTLLELLEGWDKFVELPAAAATKRLLSMLERDDVGLERLAAASVTEPARVRERLYQLLQRGGHAPLAAQIARPRSAATRTRANAVFG